MLNVNRETKDEEKTCLRLKKFMDHKKAIRRCSTESFYNEPKKSRKSRKSPIHNEIMRRKQTISFLFMTSRWRKISWGFWWISRWLKNAKITRVFIDGRKWSLKIHKQQAFVIDIWQKCWKISVFHLPKTTHGIVELIRRKKAEKRPLPKHANNALLSNKRIKPAITFVST